MSKFGWKIERHKKFICPIIDLIGTLSFTISMTLAPLTVGIIRFFQQPGSRGPYRISLIFGVCLLTLSAFFSSIVSVPEWLFLSHSIFYGLGSSFIFMTSSLVIGEWFNKLHKHHVLATSILLCGYPVGMSFSNT